MQQKEHLDYLIITIIIPLLAIFGVLLISFLFYVPLRGWPEGNVIELSNLDGLNWLPSLALLLTFVVLPVMYERLSGISFGDYGLKLPKRSPFIIFNALIIGVFMHCIYLLTQYTMYDGSSGLVSDIDLSPGFLVIHFIPLSIAEESLFRGFIQRRLCRLWGSWIGIVITAVLFAFILHLSESFLSTLLYRFPAGLVLGWLYLRTGSIWPPVLCHWAYNSTPALITMWIL